MKLAILKIILWPKDQSLEPRAIDFLPGKINVLTGESATGKSSLTWIVDYCLGSEKCSIPVGLIRDVTEWFGLHLQLANTEMLVARRNPGDNQTTNELFWDEGQNLNVPLVIGKNARVDDLKNRFNQISQLPSLDFSTDDNVGYGRRPSCRDMAAFNFQPQHIVANPYTLFFKADTQEHREKLRIIFPLVLGALDADTLAKQRELKDTERDHDRLRRELDARVASARAWEAEVEGYYLQARGLGLLPESSSPQPGWTLEKYMLELQSVPETVRRLDLPDVQEGTGERATTELTRLIEAEDQLGQEIGALRRRLDKLDQLNSSMTEYGISLTSQEDRLQGVGWFAKSITTHQCPVCSAVHAEENPQIADLKVLAGEFQSLSTQVQHAPPKLDEALAELKQDLRSREAEITKVRQTRKIVEGRTEVEAAQRQHVRQIYLFVGRVEQALENVAASQNFGELGEKVTALAKRIAELKRELDPQAQKHRLNAAVDSVSARIAEYARILKLEHATENVRLNVRELTLQFSQLSGRTDYLWEVGSGQNWLGYHVATLLALHEHFISLQESAVPRFLMIDQPSQVYFPEGWPALEEESEMQPEEVSSDIEGVRRIFHALSHFIEAVRGQFQLIVTEHAGAITWNQVSNVNLVGNWRENHDEFLIPQSWIQKMGEKNS